MLDNWQTCFKDSLTLKTRTNVSKALEGRNTIYHAEDEIPVPDAISYLTAVRDIAIAVSADVVADTVRAFIDDQLRHATTPKTHEASRAAHDGGQQYTASSPASRAPPAPEKLAEPANAADPLVKPSRKWDCRGI